MQTVANPAAAGGDLLEALDAQCGDYRAMYETGLRQRDCLRLGDLTGLSRASEGMKALMDRLRVRQARLPADLLQVEQADAEVARRTGHIRQLLHAILALGSQSEGEARRLLEETRRDLRRFDAGRRASRGYQPHCAAGPRFVDHRR